MKIKILQIKAGAASNRPHHLACIIQHHLTFWLRYLPDLLRARAAANELHNFSSKRIIVGLCVRLEVEILVPHHSVFINHVDSTLVKTVLRIETAIHTRDFVVIVLQQWKGQMLRRSPGFVRENSVTADTQQFNIQFRKVAPSVPEGAYFSRSAR